MGIFPEITEHNKTWEAEGGSKLQLLILLKFTMKIFSFST